tara:strand:- start:2444 stop:2716 length:273 start_codon:yes stop_codon:yes gene_type:complete
MFYTIKKNFVDKFFKDIYTTKPTFKLSQLTDLEIEGVDMADYPDFCDAFIASGYVTTGDNECRELTDEEINYINEENLDIINELAHDSLH